MNKPIQVLLRQFEGEYRYPNGLLSDAADYIDSLEEELERHGVIILPPRENMKERDNK